MDLGVPAALILITPLPPRPPVFAQRCVPAHAWAQLCHPGCSKEQERVGDPRKLQHRS